MSFRAFLTLLFCIASTNSKFIRKCCPENSIVMEDVCQPLKGPTPVHPLMKPNITIVYNKSCNLHEYQLSLTVAEYLMVLHENNSLTVSQFGPRMFHSTMYCLDYIEDKPGVLLCFPQEWQDKEKLVFEFGK